jgi:hypothetical protein
MLVACAPQMGPQDHPTVGNRVDAQSLRAVDDVLPERISAEDRALALGGVDAAPAPRRGLVFRLVILAISIVFIPVGLVLRLLTTPFRARLRAAYERRVERESQRRLDVLEVACRRLDASPADLDALFDRGVALLAAGEPGQAEADFDACVHSLEDGAPARVELAIAVHRRALARRALGTRARMEEDLARARALGWRPPFVRLLIAHLWWGAIKLALWAVLHEDDDEG